MRAKGIELISVEDYKFMLQKKRGKEGWLGIQMIFGPSIALNEKQMHSFTLLGQSR
jgi:hypothetical protein